MWRRRLEVQPSSWEAPSTGPRVLIEHHDASIGTAIANLLAAEGYQVATCSGPDEQVGTCALVTSGVCDRAAEADVVFFGLRISDELDRAVLAALRRHFQDTPVIVEMPASRVPLYQEELEGCLVLPQPATRDSVLSAVEKALR